VSWLPPQVPSQDQFSPLLPEERTGHVAPCQQTRGAGCRGNAFPRGQARTYFGRGALRLSGGRWLTTPHRAAVNVRWGSGRPFRRSR